MERIIELLQERNHYLEKFYSLNEIEIKNLSDGKLENLDYFYENRESILNIIKYLENEIAASQEGLGLNYIPTYEEVQSVKLSLSIKKQFVDKIIDLDLQILNRIEKIKSDVIRELQDVRKARKAVGSYGARSKSYMLDEEM